MAENIAVSGRAHAMRPYKIIKNILSAPGLSPGADSSQR
jgi:hypothetical protein